ncbi:CapA family protein [Oceanobacillus halophilus]|uniref:CapA family protein n=1 Tax=Oceanobacillus halophilus TaxID=930130 RepID=A0A495A422_9BACI|nr:CapA family protein [Oceanobacillus halophilus]RKQ34298.1 CapA family protein [Oceanobacillus halophilus]
MPTLFVCGDIVNYENANGMICSDLLADKIRKVDFSIGNLEAPIEGVGEPIRKIGPHHFQRKSTIDGLKKQGFDLLCLANNHMMDYGEQGLLATIEEAERAEIKTVGAGKTLEEAYQPLVTTIRDLKIGFINACEAQFGVLDYHSKSNQPGYAWINHDRIDEMILELKNVCDFVIVLAHAGLEHYSIPQKEWRHRYKHFCHLGADIVVGSHPHVPQGYEYYRDSLIFYSLGNFYFDSANFKEKEDRSYSVILDLNKDRPIKFEPVFHQKQDGKVQLSSPEKQINLEHLNASLDQEYEDLLEQMSLDIFHNRIKGKLSDSLLPFPLERSWKSTIKNFIRKRLGRNRVDKKEIQLLHYLRNESYYYAARHALEVLSKK